MLAARSMGGRVDGSCRRGVVSTGEVVEEGEEGEESDEGGVPRHHRICSAYRLFK